MRRLKMSTTPQILFQYSSKELEKAYDLEVAAVYKDLLKQYQDNPFKCYSDPLVAHGVAWYVDVGVAIDSDLKRRARNAVRHEHLKKLLESFKQLNVKAFLDELAILKSSDPYISGELFSKKFPGDYTHGVGGAMLRHLYLHEKGLKESRSSEYDKIEFTESNKSIYVFMLQALAD